MALTASRPVFVPFLKQLDSVGDGSGSTSITADYLGAPQVFTYRPTVTQTALLGQVIIQYTDNGSFEPDVYGSLASALAVGVSLDIYDRNDVIISQLTDGLFVTQNDQWYQVGFDFNYNNWAGSNRNTLSTGLHSVDFGTALVLDGTNGQYLGFSVADDFTSFFSQTVTVKGHFL